MKIQEINDQDLPSIFNAADKVSISSQRSYKLIIGLNLAILILATIIVVFISSDDSSNLFTKINAFLLLGGALLTTSIFFGKFDKNWYDGRALAESIKTVSWKYMMRVDPFNEMSNLDVDTIFLDMIDSIRKQRPGFSAIVPKELINDQQITDMMRKVRKLTLQKRLEFYIKIE